MMDGIKDGIPTQQNADRICAALVRELSRARRGKELCEAGDALIHVRFMTKDWVEHSSRRNEHTNERP